MIGNICLVYFMYNGTERVIFSMKSKLERVKDTKFGGSLHLLQSIFQQTRHRH